MAGRKPSIFKPLVMVHIQQFDNDRELFVNDKLVVKNMDGLWQAKIELTTAEERALYDHVNQ